MSISQPSREIYVIDVPESKELQGTFFYNFFVPDESVNETGGVPLNVLARQGSEIDSSFIQYSITRAPRFVQLSFIAPKLADVGNQVSDKLMRDNAFRTTGMQDGSLILRNIGKVVNEDDFASNNYVSVHFHDGDVDKKVHQLVSGSISQLSLSEDVDQNNSPYKLAQRLIPMLPKSISPHWLTQALTDPQNSYGGRFNAKKQETGAVKRGALRSYFQRLAAVGINTQINVKLLDELINKTIDDPTSTNAADIMHMHGYAKQVKQAVNQRFTTAVSESDYKTFVPFIDVKRHDTSPHAEKYAPQIVGYIIDKFEILSDGSTKVHSPIIIDSPYVTSTADFRVKFNANYCYTVRTVALLTMPAIDEDSGGLAMIKVLISSKPSNKIYVSTLKLRNPPPPADVNFVWNYETDKLMVTWAFPVTSERDVKQFQVFRRENIDHCFELQKVYNFDDSVVTFPNPEIADTALVERLTSPATWWIDDEFKKDVNFAKDKGMIYTICAVDAHAQTSNYSAQYRVWFDRFKNKLQKELISHAGAPKPYPNLYLEGDIFENTIRVSGPHTKRLKLFFNPEHYFLYDDNGRIQRTLSTNQSGGSYKLQFINLDNLKGHDLTINIDDRLSAQQRTIGYPTVQFGPKRKPQPSR